MMYDAIVVGASPAGLVTTWKSAKAGIKVLLIDRKERLGVQHHPADTIFKGMFRRTGLDLHEDYVLHEVRGMQVISPSGFRVSIESPGVAIDRKEFDLYYAELAQDAGAEIKTKTRAIGLSTHRKGWRLVVREREERKTYEASIVVGADGIESYVARWLGMRPMRFPFEIAPAVQAEMIKVDIDFPDYFQYFIGRSFAPGWKATISPKGDNRASVGVFVRKAPKPAIDYFNRFVKHNKLVSTTFRNAKIVKMLAGGDPIVTIPHEIVNDGVMIVGGAAAQSGIAYGMLSGMICGKTIVKSLEEEDTSKRTLSLYLREWKNQLGSEYKLAYYALKSLERLSDDQIDKMIAPLSGQKLVLEGPMMIKAFRASLIALRNDPSIFLLAKKVLPAFFQATLSLSIG